LLAIEAPVDLGEVKRTLTAQTTGASLVGLTGGDLELVPRSGAHRDAVRAPVGGLSQGTLVLVAMPLVSTARGSIRCGSARSRSRCSCCSASWSRSFRTTD